jgi:ribosomal-protein-alanine N-acetyltransferase
LKANPELFVRLMEPEDLAAVAGIDQEAFEPIWQNSLSQVEQAYEQSAIATVAEWENAIVGFQISTVNMFAAHLARLAVNPALQGRQIGTTLLSDLVQRCRSERLWQITINTQDDNHASLALYQRTGWTLTGERFPVYLYKD